LQIAAGAVALSERQLLAIGIFYRAYVLIAKILAISEKIKNLTTLDSRQKRAGMTDKNLVLAQYQLCYSYYVVITKILHK